MDEIRLLSPTKAVILRGLLGGPKTAKEIARDLEIQVSAARKHLERLKELGALEERFARVGRGRPKKFYEITDSGREVFPRHYDAVLNSVLANLAKDRGEEYAESILRKVAREFARPVRSARASGRARIEQLLNLLTALGFEPDANERKGVVTITSRNCPLLKTAKAHRELVCRGLHAEAIRASAGVREVSRDKWMVDGDPICTHSFTT